MSEDTIYRQSAIDAVSEACEECRGTFARCEEKLQALPSAEPERKVFEEMSDTEFEKWLYEHGICNPDIHESISCSIVPLLIDNAINELPSAQPERTCVNCGRTINNGGWYADGRTRCPIEEHYALPKDGFCHLWEKRNITDDDYPERRADEPDR